MNNKICVYAICKDELENIDRWLNSMNEADYIVVLDTGSTDGSYEALKSDPRVFRVEQKLIDNVKDRNVIKDLMEPSYICKKD